MDPSRPRVVLRQFGRAIEREIHVLERWPEILWQQFYDRLRWEDPSTAGLVEAERARRGTTGGRPWLRRRTPLPDLPALVRTLAYHKDVSACTFSPDGSYIVSAGGSELRIWDPSSGACRWVHELETWDCAMSPDGSFFASIRRTRHRTRPVWTGGDTIEIWNPSTQDVMHTLRIPGEEIMACSVSPDGDSIVTMSQADGTSILRRLEIQTGRALWSWRAGSLEFPGNRIGVSPDGTYVFGVGARASGRPDRDEVVWQWDLETGKVIRRLRERAFVQACAVSPDGAFLVSGTEAGTLTLWDPRTGAEIRSLQAHRKRVTDCVVSPDGARILSSSDDDTVKVWDSAGGTCLATHHGLSGRLAISSDGSLAASVGGRTIRLWDPDGKEGTSLERHDREVADCATTFSAGFAVSASFDDVKLWNLHDGRCIRTVPTGGAHGCVAITPDGSWLVCGRRGGSREPGSGALTVLDPQSGAERATLESRASARGCAISPDGAYAVSTVDLTIWDAATGEERWTLSGDPGGGACAVSPDGSFVVSAGEDGIQQVSLKIWDPAGGTLLRTLGGSDEIRVVGVPSPQGGGTLLRTLGEVHTLPVTACAVSPDGTLIASIGGDRTMKLWDTSSGRLVRSIEVWDPRTWAREMIHSSTRRVSDCAFTPDGRLLASVADDGMLKLWSAETGDLLAKMPLESLLSCVDLAPSAVPGGPTVAACGGGSGVLHLIELIGFGEGPVILTARERGDGLSVRCPCGADVPVERSDLGTEIACSGCGRPLAVNSTALLPGERVLRSSTLQRAKSRRSSILERLRGLLRPR